MIPSAYPVWIGARGGDPEKAVLGGKMESGSYFLAVFTDKNLIERYAKACGASDAQPFGVPSAAAFADTLRISTEVGFTHVVFDYPGMGDITQKSVTIADLLEQVEGKP